jgi:hypothetical protein
MGAAATVAVLAATTAPNAHACGRCETEDCVTDWVSTRQCRKERELKSAPASCPGTPRGTAFPPGLTPTTQDPCAGPIIYQYRCRDDGACPGRFTASYSFFTNLSAVTETTSAIFSKN